MSTSLERVRSRYETTPRKLDATLDRMARGDRGCLPDIVSGVGALSMFALLILSGMQIVPFALVYVGAATWVGGFFWGSYVQAQSGVARRKALEHGPLVQGRVVWCEPHLTQKGRQAGRAVVAFRVDEAGQFAPESLVDLAESLASHPLVESLSRELGEEEAPEFTVVPESLEAPGEAWLCRVVVYPDRLPQRVLVVGDPLVMIVDTEHGFAEHIPSF